jgi:hypothetical protein
MTNILKNSEPVGNLEKRATDFVCLAPLAWTASLRVLFSFMGADMKTQAKTLEQEIEYEVMMKERNKKEIKRCAAKFEQIVREARMRLGLEVSHA